MDQTGKQLLNLMFRAGETICVSQNKYGYHSLPLEEVLDKDAVTLVPTASSCESRGVEWGPEQFEKTLTGNLTLVALNPIKGFREDMNCIAFRNFLIEMDTGPLDQQLAYIKKLGLPYSAIIFSGNKSLHFLVSLASDLPNEDTYRTISEWILNICTLADQKTKNPSRSIRIPGAYREIDKKQRLVGLKKAITIEELGEWLKKYPEARPKKPEKKAPLDDANINGMKKWVKNKLRYGLDPKKGRNQQWHGIAYEFALQGYSEDVTMTILGQYFVPDRDFKEREWRTAIKSAFKSVRGK